MSDFERSSCRSDDASATVYRLHEAQDLITSPAYIVIKAAFVEHYNHCRAHESFGNLTPADVHFGHGEGILAERKRIKRQNLMDRRLRHHAQAA